MIYSYFLNSAAIQQNLTVLTIVLAFCSAVCFNNWLNNLHLPENDTWSVFLIRILDKIAEVILLFHWDYYIKIENVEYRIYNIMRTPNHFLQLKTIWFLYSGVNHSYFRKIIQIIFFEPKNSWNKLFRSYKNNFRSFNKIKIALFYCYLYFWYCNELLNIVSNVGN